MPAPVVLVTDEHGVVQDANRAAVALLGECLGRNCCELFGAVECRCAALGARTGTDVELGCSTVRGISGPLASTEVAGGRLVVFHPRSVGEACQLTGRERDVLRRIALGDTDEEAGAALGIGVSTVRTHLESARRKLGARTRTHAVARAMGAGLLDPGP